VSFEFLDLGELLDSPADVLEALSREVGARDVLDERAEVDTRVLLCVTVCGCDNVSWFLFVTPDNTNGARNTYAKSG
jgi:hypothetical protein